MCVLLVVSLLLALLGSGLMAGLFYAFSVAVMPALAQEPAPAAASAMQRINVVIVRPVFLLVFVGTVVAALVSVVLAFVGHDTATATATAGAIWTATLWAVAGTVLHLGASIGLTAAYHVPRNDALAATDPTTPEGGRVWTTYQREWVRWNHVRTVGCLLATACFAIALTRT